MTNETSPCHFPALSNKYIKRKRLLLSITCQVTALKKVGYGSIYLNSLYTTKTSPSESCTIFRLNKLPYLSGWKVCRFIGSWNITFIFPFYFFNRVAPVVCSRQNILLYICYISRPDPHYYLENYFLCGKIF